MIQLLLIVRSIIFKLVNYYVFKNIINKMNELFFNERNTNKSLTELVGRCSREKHSV